jgi:hypothetical protein
MAGRLVPWLATQVARVRFLVLARPTFRVEKVALFCNLYQIDQIDQKHQKYQIY